jgi:hypothetical protein
MILIYMVTFSRIVSNRNILDNFSIEFSKIVEKYTDYIIVSGFVAIASGRLRGTEDIDMVIKKISKEKFCDLHKNLEKKGFICVQSDNCNEIYDYLNDKSSVRYTYKNKPVPEMEIKFEKDALDELQFKTKTKLPLTGLSLWFSSINMNIAFKEELLKSDKDIEDSIHLRKVYNELIDENEIKKIKQLIKRLRL